MLNTLHTVCFMNGLSIYEIKRICHRAYFFRISDGSFQHLTNFLKVLNDNPGSKYRAKTVVIFRQLLSFAHDHNLLRKCASLFVIPCCDKILHNIFGQFVEHRS